MIPDCRLQPRQVEQMHPGDTGGVEPWALFEDSAGNAYLVGEAYVEPTRAGLMTVTCTAKGFEVDASRVPVGHKWARKVWHTPYRVVSFCGAGC